MAFRTGPEVPHPRPNGRDLGLYNKVTGALEGPVAFEVDDTDPASRSGWSVVVRGAATEAPFLQEYLRAFELAQIPWVAGAKTQIIVIDPTIVTGRLLPAPAITGFSQP